MAAAVDLRLPLPLLLCAGSARSEGPGPFSSVSGLFSALRYWLGFGWLGKLFSGGKSTSTSSSASSRPYHDFSLPGGPLSLGLTCTLYTV